MGCPSLAESWTDRVDGAMKEFCLGISVAQNLMYAQLALDGGGGCEERRTVDPPCGHTDCENLQPTTPEGDQFPGNIKFTKVNKPNPVQLLVQAT